MMRGGKEKHCDERMAVGFGGEARGRLGGIMLLLAPQLQHEALLLPCGPFLLLRVCAVTYHGIKKGGERD